MALLPVPVQQFMVEEKPTLFAQMSRKRRAKSDFTAWQIDKTELASLSQLSALSETRVAHWVRAFPDKDAGVTSSWEKPHNRLEKSSAELQQVFNSLVEEWREETGHLSSTLHKVTHPAYQRVIGLGPRILPLLLHELQLRPNFWFWALKAISGEDPGRGIDNVEDATAAWIKWGIEQEII